MTDTNPHGGNGSAPPPNIPTVLQVYGDQKRWVVWNYVERKGKKTKPPYNPRRVRQPQTDYAKNDDPSTWGTLDEAVAAVQRLPWLEGIGIELGGSDICAFDLDNCVDPATQILHYWAQQLVDRCNSFTYVTVSGTGLRILGRTRVSGTGKGRKQKVDGKFSCESYRATNRYITVNGRHLEGTPMTLAYLDEIMDAVVQELDALNGRSSEADSGTTNGAAAGSFTIEPLTEDDPRLAALGPEWIELGIKGAGPRGVRSEPVFGFVCECVRQNISDSVIASILMYWKIGEHIRDQSNVERSLSRTIKNAHEKIKDSKLFAMNERYCVLPIGGKTRVATWDNDPEFPGHRTIAMFSSLSDFKSLKDKYRHSYQQLNANSEVETVSVKLGTWWVGNTGRRQYDGGMKFVPTCDDDVVNGNTLNLWQGFKVAARKPEGKSGAKGCQLFLDHARKIICSGDEEHYDYLIKREAFIAQRRTRSEIAVGFRTDAEGTGKGLYSRTLNYLYGIHAMEIQNPDHVVGKYNPHLEKILRLTADEALFAMNPLHRNALYNLITEPRITIEPKFVNAYPADNYLNVDVISNAEHFLPVSGHARRFFVPTVSQERANDHAYFRAILNQLRDGGYEALLYHLLHEVDIRDFNVREVPKTAALREQAAYSRKGVDLLVEIACNRAIAPWQKADDPGFSVSTGYNRREGFDYFIDNHSDYQLKSLGWLKVKRLLSKNWGCLTGEAARTQNQGRRSRGIRWPNLADLRAKFTTKYGTQDWTTDATEWVGDDDEM